MELHVFAIPSITSTQRDKYKKVQPPSSQDCAYAVFECTSIHAATSLPIAEYRACAKQT